MTTFDRLIREIGEPSVTFEFRNVRIGFTPADIDVSLEKDVLRFAALTEELDQATPERRQEIISEMQAICISFRLDNYGQGRVGDHLIANMILVGAREAQKYAEGLPEKSRIGIQAMLRKAADFQSGADREILC